MRLGYDFTGWYFDESLMHPVSENQIFKQDTVLYAGWKNQSIRLLTISMEVILLIIQLKNSAMIRQPVFGQTRKTRIHIQGMERSPWTHSSFTDERQYGRKSIKRGLGKG